MNEKSKLTQLGRHLFNTNVIGTDFADVHVFKVTGRPFPQQPDGAGVHVSFSVSVHALEKMRGEGHQALNALLGDNETDGS